jgi:hypothetical protein
MKVRYKKDGVIGFSSVFNICSTCEVLVDGDWGGDSAFISDLDVEIDGGWVDMHKAFTDRLIVPDNYNEHFFKPVDEVCRQRGYNP